MARKSPQWLVVCGASFLEPTTRIAAYGAVVSVKHWGTAAPYYGSSSSSRGRQNCCSAASDRRIFGNSASLWDASRWNSRISLIQCGARSTNSDTTADVSSANTNEMWESSSDIDGGFGDDEEEEEEEEDGGEFVNADDTIDHATVKDDALMEEFERWLKAVEKAESTLEKKRFSLQTELEKAAKVESITERANLLKTYIYAFSPGQTSATVQDWEQDGKEVVLTLDSKYDSAASEVDALFTQIRKLKRGSAVVSDLLEGTLASVEELQVLKSDLVAAKQTATVNNNLLRLIQDRLIRSSRSTTFVPPSDTHGNQKGQQQQRQKNRKNGRTRATKKPALGTPASNVRKVTTAAGHTILVGRNRRGNEHLSLVVARGRDVWMHARGTPGAHVVLLQRGNNNAVATDACRQQAADLAAFYSDARGERKVSVTVAEPKHVQKPRGAPLGAVKLREEQCVYVGYPEDVPEELKEARKVSGLADEYRAADKAKLRKQNRAQVKKQKEAKKNAKKAKQKSRS